MGQTTQQVPNCRFCLRSCLLTVWLLKPCRLTVPTVGSSIQFCPPVGLTQAKSQNISFKNQPMRISGLLGSNFPDEWPDGLPENLWTAKNLESSPWTSLWLQWVYFYYFASRMVAYHRKEVSLGLSPFLRKGSQYHKPSPSKDWANNDILQSPAFC